MADVIKPIDYFSHLDQADLTRAVKDIIIALVKRLPDQRVSMPVPELDNVKGDVLLMSSDGKNIIMQVNRAK